MAETISSADLFGPPVVNSGELFNNKPAAQPSQDDFWKKLEERGQAMTESAAQAMFGIKPSSPALQAKYPVQSFTTGVVSGTLPYLLPSARGAATLAKFGLIPAAHEIIRQLTTPEETLSPAQRASKVLTTGALGVGTGALFEQSDLLKTIAQRVAAKGLAGGTTAFADSLAQDALSGRDPDLKNALTSSALNAATIGLLGAAVEIPALRSAVISEASNIAGRPLNYEQSKSFLKSGKLFDEKGRLVGVTAPTDPEALSPVFKTAMADVKQRSLEKSNSEIAKNLGVHKDIVNQVMKERSIRSILNTVDTQIYEKVKSATGRSEVFDWRQGLDYQLDYSKVNPKTAAEIRNLIDFRRSVATGTSPVEAMWKLQVVSQLNVKDYIQQVMQNEYNNVAAKHKEFIKSVESPKEQTVSFFNPGKIESVGATEQLRPYRPLENAPAASFLPYLQQALDRIKAEQEVKPIEERRVIPDAVNLNHIQKDELLKDIQLKVINNMNEKEIVDEVINKLSRPDTDLTHEISVLSSHQGKEDAPTKTRIYDWRNLRDITPREYARDLVQLNIQRKSQGLPEIDPAKDIVVHRAVFKGQMGGVAKQVRNLLIDEYSRAKRDVSRVKEVVSTEQLFAQPTEPALEPAPAPMQVQEAPSSSEKISSEELFPNAEEIHEERRLGQEETMRTEVMSEQYTQQQGSAIKSDVSVQLEEVLEKFQDWYRGFKEVDDLTKIAEESGSSYKIRDARQLPSYGSEESVAFPKQKKSNKKNIDAKNIASWKQQLSKHADFLWSFNLSEVKSSAETKTEEVQTIVNNLIKKLNLESDKNPSKVLYAIDELKSMIRDSQREIVSENRKKLNKAKIDDYVPDDEVDKDWQEFSQKDPEDDEDPTVAEDAQDFEGDNEGPWISGEAGRVSLPTKIRILKHTSEERDAPIFEVIKKIKQFPFVSNVTSFFTTKYKRQKEEADLRNYFKVPAEAQSLLIDASMYLEAVRDLAYEDLFPIAEDIKNNVKEYLKQTGVKVDKDTLNQRIDALASLLLPHASEQVIIKMFDPNNYAFSKLGNGPHLSQQEADSYVKHVQKAYQYFNIQPNDPLFRTEAQLRAGREPIYFKLLTHPNVIHNDSLQRAVLFWKAQLEQYAFEAQIKEGIFSNADIVRAYLEGYHRSSYVMQGAQAGGESFKGNPLSGIQKPSKKYRSHAEFLDRASTEGLVPVNDWFMDNFDYLVEAMASIKQAQLLKMVGQVKLPKIEYEDPELVKALKDNPSPYVFHVIENATNSNIIEEAKRMSTILNKEITPQRILQEGGWREGNSEWGLNKWYRGGFSPPFIYKPYAEQIRTIFRPHMRATDLLSKTAKLSQAILTINPLDNLTYLSGAVLARPAWEVPFYVTALPFRAVGAAAKGIFSTGPKIAKGESLPAVGKDDYERGWARLFTEAGSTSTAGFKTFMRHLIDKKDTGLFAWRQGRGDDFSNYLASALGTSQEVIGQMISHDILQAMIKIAENEVSKGRSVREAAKFAAHFMNTASWNIHHSAYQGKFADFMSNYLFISRNFLINLVRIPMIIGGNIKIPGTNASPFQPIKKAGGYNFKTAGGAKPLIGEIQNSIMGADVPEEYREAMAWKLLGTLLGLAFLQMLVNGMIQYSIAQTKGRPDKENFLENPEGTSGKAWLGVVDPLGKEVYATTSFFKIINDMSNFWAPLYDPLANSLLRSAGIDSKIKGRGPVEVVKGKFGFVPGLAEALTDRSLYDPNPDAWAQNVIRGLSKTFEGTVPGNPYFGSGEIPYDFSSDTIENNILKASSMAGVNLTRSYDEKFSKDIMTVKSEMFKKKEVSSKIFTAQQARDAFKEGMITTNQLKEHIMKQGNPKAYFMKRNRRILQQAQD